MLWFWLWGRSWPLICSNASAAPCSRSSKCPSGRGEDRRRTPPPVCLSAACVPHCDVEGRQQLSIQLIHPEQLPEVVTAAPS